MKNEIKEIGHEEKEKKKNVIIKAATKLLPKLISLPPYHGLEFETRNNRLRVTRVLEHSPAEQSGFKAGMAIMSVHGIPVLKESDFKNILAPSKIGEAVPVIAKYEAIDRSLHLTLGIQGHTMNSLAALQRIVREKTVMDSDYTLPEFTSLFEDDHLQNKSDEKARVVPPIPSLALNNWEREFKNSYQKPLLSLREKLYASMPPTEFLRTQLADWNDWSRLMGYIATLANIYKDESLELRTLFNELGEGLEELNYHYDNWDHPKMEKNKKLIY